MSQQTDTLALTDSIVSSLHFRLAIRDIVLQINDQIKAKDQSENQLQIPAHHLVDEIGNQIELFVKNQTDKYLHQSEQLVQYNYQLRKKQYEDELEEKLEEQLRRIEERLKECIEKANFQILTPSTTNQCEEEDKDLIIKKRRNNLKKSVISCASLGEKNKENENSTSFLNNSQQNQSKTLDVIENKMKQISLDFYKEMGKLAEKIKGTQQKMDKKITYLETNLKDQLSGSLEGIWNIISNLENRSYNPYANKQ